MKLNQIIAIEKGVKSRAFSRIEELYKDIQKPALFDGLSRTYQPKDEAGEVLPPENKVVQKRVSDVLGAVRLELGEMLDITVARDRGNQGAVADVRIGGAVILDKVPATTLLTLEKQLVNLRSFADKLPVLDIAKTWAIDPNSGMYRSEAVQTTRTQKIQEPRVVVPPTEHHPAQVAMLTHDVIAGFWTQVSHSAAIPAPEKEALVRRIDLLIVAVKQAREEANSLEVTPEPGVSGPIFEYLFTKQG